MLEIVSEMNSCVVNDSLAAIYPQYVISIKRLIKSAQALHQLDETLQKHDEAYYIRSMPVITDAEYDDLKSSQKKLQSQLKRHIRQLLNDIDDTKTVLSAPLSAFLIQEGNSKNDILKEIYLLLKNLEYAIVLRQSKVGVSINSRFQKVKHRHPMLSLDNCFSSDGIVDFVDRMKKILQKNNEVVNDDTQLEIICELKIDGVSFSAIYEKGHLKRAVTRGDGSYGEDITANVKEVIGVPMEISYCDELEVRGEIYMDKEVFMTLNDNRKQSGKKLFANPRNAASGSLRQLDPRITKIRKLKYFIWDIDCDNSNLNTHFAKLMFGKELGFCVSVNITVVNSVDAMIAYYKKIELMRATLDHDIDGVVYKVNAVQYQKQIGNTSSAPRWAIAYKFNAREATTKIIDIILQVSKSGVLTPVAELTPVNIGGVVVSRATLHNAKEVLMNDYRVNDTIKIVRAGDVVPQVVEVIERDSLSQKFVFPKHCPVCSADIVDDATLTTKICTGGISCKAQTIEKLKHFVSRDAFNITGLGKKQIEYFFNANLITTYADIFTLEKRNGTLSVPLQQLKGFGEKSVDVLFRAINEVKVIAFDKFLYSISIPNVGTEVASIIAKHFNTYENFISVVKADDSMTQLSMISGIGDKIASAIVSFFYNSHNIQVITDLLVHIVISGMHDDTTGIMTNADLTGINFVFTGTLSHYSRDEAEKISKQHGAKYTASVSKKTNYVVIGANPSSSKIAKAALYGIQVITEEEWLKMIEKKY